MIGMNNLSDQKYWDDGYLRNGRGETLPDLADFRNLPDRRIIDAIEGLGLRGKRVLELGAGDSSILLALSRHLRSASTFVGLDYSNAGCASLARRARGAGVDVQVVNTDMFSPPQELVGKFDVVYSVGLVEHFVQLSQVLAAKGRFLAPGGMVFTLIPNMSGVIGKLTRRFNKDVYDIHNPHDMRSFLEGHAQAGLEVVRAGYLCSTNFGVLSSCFDASKARGWRLYVLLSRVSKALWLFESKFIELPKSAFLSPYIYAVSRINTRLPDVIGDRNDDGSSARRDLS